MTRNQRASLERSLARLKTNTHLTPALAADGKIQFTALTLEQVAALLQDEAGSLFLLAAADLNRTALRSGIQQPDAQLVAQPLRRAFVVKAKLPDTGDFDLV